MKRCRLCLGEIRSVSSDRDAHVCAIKNAIPPADCWLESPSSIKTLCAKSLQYKPLNHFEDRATAFRLVGEVGEKSDHYIRNALLTLTPSQRYELMRNALPELKAKLSPLLTDLQIERLEPPDREQHIPDDLPSGLQSELIRYRDRLTRRLDLLRRRGHTRSYRYVYDSMRVPIRLARFLHSQGITTWDGARKRDIVAFLAENPLVRPAALTRLMRALTEDQPFSERRGRYIRGRAAANPAPLQAVLAPTELESILKDIKDTRSEVEYAAAWLVGKLGMTATAAYGLTADRLKMNDEGRLVIRPAKVWVVVPKSIAKILLKVLDQAAVGWRAASHDEFKFIRVFDTQLPDIDVFRREVLGGDARRLRASAIYAAMLRGNLDRVTLNHTMGVSFPTIASIERHLSADVHRKLAPELVAARNKVLRGEQSHDK